MDKQEELSDKLRAWQYLTELPLELHGFSLSVAVQEDDDEIGIFTYAALDSRRWVKGYYNKATGSYILKKFFGLNDYCDMAFISLDLSAFEIVLRARLADCLADLSGFSRERAGCLVGETGLLDWEYGKQLPPELHGFSLYVKPWQPVRFINGLVIVIDYSDFAAASQLVIYYNELKSDFYAEKKVGGVVFTMTLFDARGVKALEKVLQEQLADYLAAFRQELSRTD